MKGIKVRSVKPGEQRSRILMEHNWKQEIKGRSRRSKKGTGDHRKVQVIKGRIRGSMEGAGDQRKKQEIKGRSMGIDGRNRGS